MNRLRPLAPVAVFLCLALALGACAADEMHVATDETGFEGAVTLISQQRDGAHAVVVARIPYLDIYGNPREGRARLVLRRDMPREGARLPAFCHVHYEMSVDGARHWADQGWAVFSAVYNEEAPIAPSPCDGNNLARAIIQWARRCPFIDGAKLHLDGGSQGGYMVLAMSADMFPVSSATADAPVVNWAYNFAYFEANRPLVQGFAAPHESPLPIMAAVLPLADMTYEHFSKNLADDAWLLLSPLSYTDRITHPVMILSVTGDMLVPMEQMTRTPLPPFDPAAFPPGYARDLDAVAPSEKTRVPFEEVLPKDQTYISRLPLQERSYVVSLDMRLGRKKHPKKKPERIDRPWSKDHQWNLCYLDEGGPEPFADHFTRAWNTGPDSFVAHYRDAQPAPEILGASKLRRLMERFQNDMSNRPVLNNGLPVNRRNFDAVERRDVIAGLLAYAALSPDHEQRLAELYQACPNKPFGDVLDATALRSALAETIL